MLIAGWFCFIAVGQNKAKIYMLAISHLKKRDQYLTSVSIFNVQNNVDHQKENTLVILSSCDITDV